MKLTVVCTQSEGVWNVNGKATFVRFGDEVMFNDAKKAMHFIDLERAVLPQHFEDYIKAMEDAGVESADDLNEAQGVDPDKKADSEPEAKKRRTAKKRKQAESK